MFFRKPALGWQAVNAWIGRVLLKPSSFSECCCQANCTELLCFDSGKPSLQGCHRYPSVKRQVRHHPVGEFCGAHLANRAKARADSFAFDSGVCRRPLDAADSLARVSADTTLPLLATEALARTSGVRFASILARVSGLCFRPVFIKASLALVSGVCRLPVLDAVNCARTSGRFIAIFRLALVSSVCFTPSAEPATRQVLKPCLAW